MYGLRSSGSIFALVIFSVCLFQGCATSSLESARAKVQQGNEEAHRGNYTQAAKSFESALADAPHSRTAKRNLGIVLVKKGEFARAAELLNGIKDYYFNDSEIYYFLGEAYRGLGDNTKALGAYKSALKISPQDLRIKKSIAWLLLKRKEYDTALKLVRRDYQANKQDLQLCLIVASVYLEKKQYKVVVGVLKAFEKSNFNLSSKDRITAETEKLLLLNVLGDAYVGLGDYVKAVKIYDEVLQIRPYLARTLIKAASCELKLSNTQDAVRKLEKALQGDPQNAEAYMLLGHIYARIDSEKAVYYYSKYIELTTSSGTPQSKNP